MTTLHEEHSGNASAENEVSTEETDVEASVVHKTPVKPQKLALNNIHTVSQVRKSTRCS
jgi:hypothetical protein